MRLLTAESYTNRAKQYHLQPEIRAELKGFGLGILMIINLGVTMFQSKNNWARGFVKAGSLGICFSLISTGAMAQTNPMAQTDGSWAETGKPVAQTGQRAINNLPNPYKTQRFFGTLPDGSGPCKGS